MLDRIIANIKHIIADFEALTAKTAIDNVSEILVHIADVLRDGRDLWDSLFGGGKGPFFATAPMSNDECCTKLKAFVAAHEGPKAAARDAQAIDPSTWAALFQLIQFIIAWFKK